MTLLALQRERKKKMQLKKFKSIQRYGVDCRHTTYLPISTCNADRLHFSIFNMDKIDEEI